MGADYYESADQKAAVIASGGIPIGIGENCTITNAIVDKNSRVGKNVKIINKEVGGSVGRKSSVARQGKPPQIGYQTNPHGP